MPVGGVYGSEVGSEDGGRLVTARKDIRVEKNLPDRRYSKHDLVDRKGNPVRVKRSPRSDLPIDLRGKAVRVDSIPDRTKDAIDRKGSSVRRASIANRNKEWFGGQRGAISKQIITEQVCDIAEYLFKEGVDFDEEGADWMVVPRYFLPPIWHDIARETALLVVFPTEYPNRPPVGFYLQADIPCSYNGHLYDAVYYEADHHPLKQGWRWYCVYVKPGDWRPAAVRRSGDWKYGDNLWDFFTLINEALASRAE